MKDLNIKFLQMMGFRFILRKCRRLGQRSEKGFVKVEGNTFVKLTLLYLYLRKMLINFDNFSFMITTYFLDFFRIE